MLFIFIITWQRRRWCVLYLDFEINVYFKDTLLIFIITWQRRRWRVLVNLSLVQAAQRKILSNFYFYRVWDG